MNNTNCSLVLLHAMRGHIRRHSVKNIPKSPTSSVSVEARDEDIPEKTDTTLNYHELVEKTAIGKMKNTVEQMLQDHLEKFTKLILMEECTSKQCYVKLKKMSYANYYDNSYKKRKSVQLFKAKKKRPRKREVNRLLSKLAKEDKDGNNHVTSLTMTIPRIRRKTHSLIANCPKKDCLIDEILHDPGESMTDELSNAKCNKSLNHLVRKPVIIHFAKRKGDDIGAKPSEDSLKHEKNKIGKENEACNKSNQGITIAEYINKKPSFCPLDGSSHVSFGTTSISNTPLTPKNPNKQNTHHSIKRWGIDWNKNQKTKKDR